MIPKEVFQLRYLDSEIALLESSINDLSSKQYPDGFAGEVAELLDIERRWLHRSKMQRDRLIRFVADLPAGTIREAVICRAVLALPWKETALQVCGRYSAAAALKKQVERYFQSVEGKPK